MENELQNNLNEIEKQKNAYIIPENIKKDVSIFGVTGILEGSSGIKHFETVEEMNASEGNNDGDLALIYNTSIADVPDEVYIDNVVFPYTDITLDSALASDFYWSGEFSPEDYPPLSSGITLTSTYFEANFSFYSGGEVHIKFESTDGLNYTRTESESGDLDIENGFSFNPSGDHVNAMLVSGNYGYPDDEGVDQNIHKFIKTKKSIFSGLYEFRGSMWSLAKTQFDVVASNVLNGEFYGRDGVAEGTLGITTNIESDEAMYPKVVALSTLSKMALSDSTTYFGSHIAYREDITILPEITFPNVKNLSYGFSNMSNLKTVLGIDAPIATNVNQIFRTCNSLEHILSINLPNITNIDSMFQYCGKLSNASLDNILDMCVKATKVTENKTLKYIGLTSSQATKCQSLSNYQAFIDAGWTTGY